MRGGRLIPGAVDREALALLRLEGPLPLGAFLKSGREEMYGASFRLRYAEGWSFVHYLFSRNDGTVDLLLRGGSLQKPQELEQGWKKHLQDMER